MSFIRHGIDINFVSPSPILGKTITYIQKQSFLKQTTNGILYTLHKSLIEFPFNCNPLKPRMKKENKQNNALFVVTNGNFKHGS